MVKVQIFITFLLLKGIITLLCIYYKNFLIFLGLPKILISLYKTPDFTQTNQDNSNVKNR